jgi:hypothetical protein
MKLAPEERAGPERPGAGTVVKKKASLGSRGRP